MNKSKYTTEDFVLDPDFKRWVLHSGSSDNSFWEEYLRKHPEKVHEIKAARNIVINMTMRTKNVSEDRLDETWDLINSKVESIKSFEKSVVPISSNSMIEKASKNSLPLLRMTYFNRVAAILIIGFVTAFFAVYFSSSTRKDPTVVTETIYKEHYAPKGVKTLVTLSDGSKVMLNSNSSIRYVNGFSGDKREIELIGEAFFEVAEDKLRPFIVHSRNSSTKALGTSFNISSYENESVIISLVTGKVEVGLEDEEKISLIPGEAIEVELDDEKFSKYLFDENKVLSWTRKEMYFDKTPINEVVRVLGNWYGVEIELVNPPSKNFKFSGSFKNKRLEDVLEGMRYSARLDYEINGKKVTINFKN